jgi:hypothetical protein
VARRQSFSVSLRYRGSATRPKNKQARLQYGDSVNEETALKSNEKAHFNSPARRLGL